MRLTGNIFPHLAAWSVPLGLCGVQPHCAQTKARPYGANLKKQPANTNSCTSTNDNAKEERQTAGRRPKPALLFLIAEKEGKKASPLGTYKTYFEPGVLQLPTVKQIKRLYNSVQNRFYKQVQKGALNGKQQRQRQKRTTTTKAVWKTALCFVPCRIVQELVLVA